MNQLHSNFLYRLSIGLIVILISTYVCSFIPGVYRRGNVKSTVKAALLHPKYANEIQEFEFGSRESLIQISKKGDTWMGALGIQGNDMIFPVADDIVDAFITELGKERTLTTITNNKDLYKNSYSMYIKVYSTNKKELQKVYLLPSTLTVNDLFVWSEQGTSVYSTTESSFLYNAFELSKWCDPSIIPQNTDLTLSIDSIKQITVLDAANSVIAVIDSKEQIADLLKLRHGKMVLNSVSDQTNTVLFSLHALVQDGRECSIICYDAKNDTSVILDYTDGMYFYQTYISNWTFENLSHLLFQ